MLFIACSTLEQFRSHIRLQEPEVAWASLTFRPGPKQVFTAAILQSVCVLHAALISGFSAKCPAGVDDCKQEIPEEPAMCDKGVGKSMESSAEIILRGSSRLLPAIANYCKWANFLVQWSVGFGQGALLITRGRAYGRKCQVQAAFRYATATDCGCLRKSHRITSHCMFC